MIGENFLTPCNPCYEYTLPEYPVFNFVIKASLAANTEHAWFVENSLGAVYRGTATTNGDGDLEIPIDEFPEDFFSQHAGKYAIYIKLNAEDADNAELTLGPGYLADTYECIHLTFYQAANFYETENIIE